MAKNNRRTIVSVTQTPARNEFNPDYSLIKRDLARIGTLAGFFLVVLIVLSFIIK